MGMVANRVAYADRRRIGEVDIDVSQGVEVAPVALRGNLAVAGKEGAPFLSGTHAMMCLPWRRTRLAYGLYAGKQATEYELLSSIGVPSRATAA